MANPNPCLAKLHRSYSIDEVARLFGVHKNTVRAWIKAGLPTIDAGRPTLIRGRELRAFLATRRKAGRRKCPPGWMYCFKCRAPRRPAADMVDLIPSTATAGNLCALCETCETVMHRRARIDAIRAVMPGIAVQFRQAEPRLGDRRAPSLNCDAAA